MKFETYREDYCDEIMYLPVPFSSEGFVDLAEQITQSLRDRSKRYRECDDTVSMIIHDNPRLQKVLELQEPVELSQNDVQELIALFKAQDEINDLEKQAIYKTGVQNTIKMFMGTK